MKKTIFITAFLFLATLIAGPALAQELVIYPAKGQSQDQMEKDKYECYRWAKEQTGFDPMQQPKATEPPPRQEPRKGGAVRGAARGAAVGYGAGKVFGDSGSKGAKYGAATGAVVGGARRRSQQRQQQQAEQQWAQDQASEYTQQRNNYNRNHAACLEGRGYTVK